MIFPVLLSIVAAIHSGQTPATAASKAKSGAKPAGKVSQKSPVKPASTQTPYLPAAPSPDTVLAKVNGVAIKGKDVDSLLWDWAGRGIMEDLILFQLIRDRAKTDKVFVTPAEVQKVFDNELVEIQKQVPGGQDLDAFIREKGYPKSRLYLHIEADLLMTKIVDLKFNRSDYINVSTLVVIPKGMQPPGQRPDPNAPKPAPPTDADKQEALGKAMDIYSHLMKGDDWDKTLVSSGQSQQTVQTHGALGWRAIAAFRATTQVEFKTLKLHQYTKPIETPNGFQIFRIDGLGVNAEPASLDALKKEYENRAKQSLAQELQTNAKIERIFGGSPTPSHVDKLKIEDKKVGVGQPVATGDEVWVTYTGRLTNGTVFDSNAKPGGILFHFTVGNGEVIKGWDQGLLGMKKGGQRKLLIPASLGYGARPMGSIPPQSDLVFDVELQDILKKADAFSISSNDVRVGAGRAVKTGDTVTVDYVARAGGQQFETRKDVKFKIGADEMQIKGFDAALIGMKVGGVREIRIPPALTRAVGNAKLGMNVGVWVITLKSIK